MRYDWSISGGFQLVWIRKVGEMGGLAAVGGLAAPFSQTHQKKTVHPNFGWKPVMLKNRKSGGTYCGGGTCAFYM